MKLSVLKKSGGILAAGTVLTAVLCFAAMAETAEISDAPGDDIGTAIIIEKAADTAAESAVPLETMASGDMSAYATESDTPMGAVAESVAALEAQTAPEDHGTEGTQTAPETQGTGTRLALDFTLVSPDADEGNLKVAEGSVQLSDGRWVTIGHDCRIRAPYYYLLREATDSTGTEWYVCRVDARRFGDYYTEDGSMVSELWLKKADCRAQNYIDIGTAGSRRAAVVRAALALLGKGYEYAGNGPDKYDCSGYAYCVMEEAGITIPRTSGSVCAMNGRIDISQLRPGDLCARQGHVGIYIGNGIFLHASESATGIIAEKLSVYNAGRNPFTRYINVFGD